MRAIYDVPAPAKLNLFLHITGRRDDGYHLIESVFVPIDWADTLNFEVRSDGIITREDLGAKLPPDDLCVRAARALQSATGCTLGTHIGLQKNVPSQAGMGGGSSDAASTLLALNRLWNLGLSREALAAIGLKLGADVPFFVGGYPAWVTGIGEELRPIEVPAARFLVVKPRAGLDTRLIFSSGDLKRDSEPAIIAGFAADAHGFGRNDLQPVAQRLCPDVNAALEWLASQGLTGRMTGSGSAVFAHVPHNGSVNWNLQTAPEGSEIRLCSSLEVHPLEGWVSSEGRLKV
jgi:4-diphosphocytidyl-2-C-methyl-D-erythritol kinase